MSKKWRKRAQERTKHHIVPTSRGGVDSTYNIAFLKRWEHECYHMLFQNLTPDEIIIRLVDHFWGGDWEWIERATLRDSFHKMGLR